MTNRQIKMVRISLSVLLILSLLSLSGCGIAPPFPGGIRIVTLQTFQGIFTSPAPGVLDAGNLQFVNGAGNGTQTAFSGVTGAFGIDDHPDALTNANWFLQTNYGPFAFNCPPDGQVVNVPLEGEVATWNCQM
jgi:hypothetical protein